MPIWVARRSGNGATKPSPGPHPALFGLFSLVTLLAQRLLSDTACPTRTAAWYAKTLPAFSDTLALVRHYLWTQTTFPLSLSDPEDQNVPRALVTHLAELLCYAT